jgi:hypothetical protein
MSLPENRVSLVIVAPLALALLSESSLATTPRQAQGETTTLVRVDGSRVEGRVVTLDPKAGASVKSATGEAATVALDDVVQVELPRRKAPPSDETPVVVQLHDGSRLVGSVKGGSEEKLELELAHAGSVSLPIDTIHALFAGPRAQTVELGRFTTPGEGDSIHRRPEVGGDFTHGTLAAFTAEGVKFEYSLGTGTFPWNEVEAVVLAKQVDVAPSAAPVVHADLEPDGTLSGTLVRMNELELVLRPAGFDQPVTLRREALRGVRVDGPRHVWLSDVAPAKVEQLPYLGPAEPFLFPWRADRTVTGRPLVVQGHRYAKGFGCHSRTSLEFALDGSFKSFRVDVGVSDETAALADHGAVEFRVLVDGVEKWKSKVVRGGDAPVAVGPIELDGAKRLTLVTDFGEGEDVADRAVWGAPLLVR